MYQHSPVTLAGDRRNAGSGARGEAFLATLQFIARRLLFSVLGLTDDERQFLHDVARSEHRYRMIALQRLMAIAARSVKPEDREALAEVVRAWCLAGVPAVTDIRLAGDLETRAQGEHDVAWRAFEVSPSLVTCERAIETGTAHEYGLRAQRDTLLAYRRVA